MDLGKLATQIFMSKISGGATQADDNTVNAALSGLIGEGDGVDLGGLIEKMKGSGLGSIAQSWLGDGDNEQISAEQVNAALGDGKLTDFASKLGIDPSEAAGGLSSLLPQLVDKSSSGGNLLESLGGAGGLLSMAKKMFGR